MISLKRDLTSQHLNDTFESGYYDYLDSKEFHQAFLRPLGNAVDLTGADSVLDVCCGFGGLFDHVLCDYYGFDASAEAVAKARNRSTEITIDLCRLEIFDGHRCKDCGKYDPCPCPPGEQQLFGYECGWCEGGELIRTQWDCIVFGGVLHCLVNDPMECIKTFAKHRPRHIVVYDLEVFDHAQIELPLIAEYHAVAQVPGINSTKRERKILTYEWPP